MAKALLGHMGVGADPRLVDEVRRLRRRVADLEQEVVRLRQAHDAFAATVTVEDDLSSLPLAVDLSEARV